MLTVDRLRDLSGNLLRGFFVRNRRGKVLAIGATGKDGWVMPSRKRYARDLSLCTALGKLTGMPVKWNIAYYAGGAFLAWRRLRKASMGTQETGVRK